MSRISADTITSREGGPPTLSQGVVVSAAGTFSSAVNIDDTTESTSSITGAVIVSGGVGIAKSLSVGGNVSVGGTLTYEDVTNQDVIGLATFRSGAQFGVAGVCGTIRANGDTTLTGVVTATSFVGGISGAVTGTTGSYSGNLTVGSGVTIGPAGVATFSGTADVHLYDGVQLNVGESSDLQIYHSGTHSFIKDGGTGNLQMWTNQLSLLNAAGDESMIQAVENSSVDLYYDNSKKFETFTGGAKVTGITSTTSLTVGPGVIQEKLYTVASALTGTVNFDVVTNGLVQYHTTNSSATWVVNLRGDGSTTLNSLLHIGQTTVFTLYSAQNNASYYMTDFQIDGASQTEKWNGGSAPTAGTASGVDVYTFNIMKTADATFTVFANFSNFA